MGEDVEAGGATGTRLDEVGGEALGEDPALTGAVPASETPGCQPDPEPPTVGREIAESPSIAAVD
jgi:hypothetical protein